MKRFFLIDFENVFDSGLSGFFDLAPEDTVLIFYTQRANKINIDFFESVLEHKNAAKLSFIRVSFGNQALDLQLASYLGGLITEDPKGCAYYIVSKDKGFHCLPTFWLGRYDSVKIYQVASISEALNAAKGESADTAFQEKKSLREENKNPVSEYGKAAVDGGDSRRDQPRIEAPKEHISFEAASTSVSESGKGLKEDENRIPNAPGGIQNEERRDIVESDASPETEHAPLKEQETPGKSSSETRNGQEKQPKTKGSGTPSSDRAAINTKVQQTLSKAKYDNNVISFVASLTAKNIGDGKFKQIVYREIIKQYGQKKGLEIYNLVKSLLK